MNLFINGTVIFIICIIILFITNNKIKKIKNKHIWFDNPKIWTNKTDINGNDNNKQLFDLYSLTHVSR